MMRRSLRNHMENAGLLELLNEKNEEILLQMCGSYAGLPTVRCLTATLFIAIAGLQPFDERRKGVDGDRENGGGVLFRCDFD